MGQKGKGGVEGDYRVNSLGEGGRSGPILLNLKFVGGEGLCSSCFQLFS